jgi:Mg2+-importing ATPase
VRSTEVPPRPVLPVATDLQLQQAAALPAVDALTALASGADGLSAHEVTRRLAAIGPNAVRSHHARAASVLLRQVRSPLLLLLATTATASAVLGQRTDASIISVIVLASVGLGFLNEYRAEQAAEALHSRLSHQCVVRRDGRAGAVDVVGLVPGDLVELRLGGVVPADLRLVSCEGLECDESMLTGESLPAQKSVEPVPSGTGLGELTSCALMGTVVTAGRATGLVVATGGRAEFGRIALGLGDRQPETAFQVGLRRFSLLLVRVAAALTTGIFLINIALQRPLLDALLFSLAIAVGISPQLLPAVVSTSLAAGARQLAEHKVLVKRLVCIEDLGDITVLFTDKTGTLTQGDIQFTRSVGPDGSDSPDPVLLGLLSSDVDLEDGHAVAGNGLDVALWESPASADSHTAARRYQRLSVEPFDHGRRIGSVLVRTPDGERLLVAKGAPESILARCAPVSPELRASLGREFDAGNRVIAVASRRLDGRDTATVDDEQGLRCQGLLVFRDAVRPDARRALDRLAELGVEVKVLTGDNPAVALRVCAELGLAVDAAVTGAELDAVTDDRLPALLAATTVFARVSPEQKARLVRAQRALGGGGAFLGDGVNDALALHAADVGVSVDSATDVAKDAADIILLEKDLGVLADGVVEGRRIFANTIKYVLMGTSSNFGNMFSAAAASALLSFLPMLPSQILLNNLLYDASQLAIPTDHVDPEDLLRPSHFDVRFIRRFMLFFGPVSSVFDFATFGVMLWVFHADADLFRTGWFVESLATQTLVIFVIRTRRSPFLRSTPSRPLLAAVLVAVLIGAGLPFTPLAHDLGFRALPFGFFLALGAMVVLYVVLIEFAKVRFYRLAAQHEEQPDRYVHPRVRRVHRRASRFSTAGPTTPPAQLSHQPRRAPSAEAARVTAGTGSP